MPNQFKKFDPKSSKQRKQQLQFELNGADFNDTLVWHSPEDIKVKPFYHRDEVLTHFQVQTQARNFKIGEDVFVFDVQKSIKKTNDVLNRGANEIRFTIENPDTDIEVLLNNCHLENKTIHFKLHFLNVEFIHKIEKIALAKNINVFYNLDPISQFATNGNWFQTSNKNNFETIKEINTKNPLLSVNIGVYQNAGSNIVQQLAYGLAHANEYFNALPNLQTTINFEVAIGSNYFFEIAKIRALRLLFRTLASEYGHDLDCNITATPTKRNKTIYDFNVNLLRSTTECMAAIIGGANTIFNLPYDVLYHKSNEFGDRIARNQLLILKSESYFDSVNNPADGSYYIENITSQLAEKSLTLFKDIEKNGGFLNQLKEETIQKKINESAQKEQNLFNEGKIILVGTNKHPNPKDVMKHNLELFPFVKHNPRKTLITPIIEKRLSEKTEQERLSKEV